MNCCTYLHSSFCSTPESHMVLQTGAPEVCKLVRHHIEALQLFVESELAMQNVLVTPGEKTTPVAPPSTATITSALKTCWELSPALASALALRYPTATDTHAQLQTLILKHASEPATLAWPQGALRYADACIAQVCCFLPDQTLHCPAPCLIRSSSSEQQSKHWQALYRDAKMQHAR